MTNTILIRGLLFVLLALAVVCSVCSLILPRQQAIADLRQQLDEREQYIQKSEHLDAQITEMENDLAAALAYVKERASQTPVDGDLDIVFGSIADEAKNSGVVTSRFQPHPEDATEAAVKRMTVTLVTEGTFQQLLDFLARLERLPLTFWIDTMQLQKVDDESDRLSCEMSLVIFADNRGNSD